MPAKPRLTLLASLLLCSLPPAAALAATIGDIRVQSYLGQPLSAAVPLTLAEDENFALFDCIQTNPASDELAGPGTIRHEFLLTGNQGLLFLRGQEVLREPIVALDIALGCGDFKTLHRTFTILLDPPPLAETVPPTLAAQPTITALPYATPAPHPVRRITKARITASGAQSSPRTALKPASGNAPASLKIEGKSATELREADLTAQLQDMARQNEQLRQELHLLENRLNRLQQHLDRRSPPVLPVKPVAGNTPQSRWPWMAGGGLGALLLVTAAWLFLRRDGHENTPETAPYPLPPNEADARQDTRSHKLPAIEVTEDDSQLDQAQYLLSEGQLLAAIEILYAETEKETVEPRAWLMLLHALSLRDSPQEFASAAERFLRNKPSPEDWQIVCSLGQDLEPDNLLYQTKTATPGRPAPLRSGSKSEPVLDFFSSPTAPKTVEEGPPRLEMDLPELPQEQAPADSALGRFSRRDAA
jgi:hypothetical protein